MQRSLQSAWAVLRDGALQIKITTPFYISSYELFDNA